MTISSLRPIYIYCGETEITEQGKREESIGVAADSVIKLKNLLENYQPKSTQLVASQDIKPKNWPENSLFVLPEGRWRDWKWLKETETINQVKEFVAKGGKLLAVGAGAYACCTQSQFKSIDTEGNEVLLEGNPGLDFFSGSGIGPRSVHWNQKLKVNVAEIKWMKTNQSDRPFYDDGRWTF